MNWRNVPRGKRQFKSGRPDHMFEINSGLGAVVARTSGGREVASSILVAPTNQGGKIEKIYFLYLNDADWKDFAEQKLTNQVNIRTIKRLFFKL